MALPPPNATTWSTLHAAVEARLPHTAFYARLPLETAEDAAEAAAIRAGYKNEERLDCNQLVCYCGKRIGVGVVTDCSCLLHSGDRRAFRSCSMPEAFSINGLRKTGRIDFFKHIHGLGLGNLGRFGGAYS